MFVFCVNDTCTTEIDTYGHTLSLHGALPIWDVGEHVEPARHVDRRQPPGPHARAAAFPCARGGGGGRTGGRRRRLRTVAGSAGARATRRRRVAATEIGRASCRERVGKYV